MAYASVDDLLLGDLRTSDRVDRSVFVNEAADDITIALGAIYVLPLNTAALAEHSRLLLKKINTYLATGRLILAVGAGGDTMSAYALGLISQGDDLLNQIATNCLDLEGATRRADQVVEQTGPRIVQQDKVSPLEVFEEFAMRGEGPEFAPRRWYPGAN